MCRNCGNSSLSAARTSQTELSIDKTDASGGGGIGRVEGIVNSLEEMKEVTLARLGGGFFAGMGSGGVECTVVITVKNASAACLRTKDWLWLMLFGIAEAGIPITSAR
jgi:hypothetical protein